MKTKRQKLEAIENEGWVDEEDSSYGHFLIPNLGMKS